MKKIFNHLLNVAFRQSKLIILSAKYHQQLKLRWIPFRKVAVCKMLFVTEYNLINSLKKHFNLINFFVNDNLHDNNMSNSHDYYQVNVNDSSSELIQNNNFENTNLARVRAFSYLDIKKYLSILTRFRLLKSFS